MIKSILIFSCLLLFLSCQVSESPPNKRVLYKDEVLALRYYENQAKQVTYATAKPKRSKRFSVVLQGTISENYPLVMKLKSDGVLVTGTYYYENNGEELKISGHINEQEMMQLKEFDKKGYITGNWRVELTNDELVGTWYSMDGMRTLPVQLTEVTPATYQPETDKVAMLK